MDQLIEHALKLASQPAIPLTAPIKKRIAYVVSHGQSYASHGYAVRTQGIARALNEHSFETLCFVRPGRPWELGVEKGSILPECQVDGVRYIHSRWPKDQTPITEKQHLEQSVQCFVELFRVYRPQAVVAASNYIVGLPAWIAAKRLGLPFYNEVRGFWELSQDAREPGYINTPEFKAEALRDTFVAKQAQKIFTLNQPMANELIKRGVATDNVAIVSNGISALPKLASAKAGLKAKLGIKDNDKVIGYIGSFSPYEGLDVLLEACNQLVQNGEKIKLLLVGDEQPVTAAVGAGGHSKESYPWLTQVGRVSHEQVADYYALTDTIVIPRKKLSVCELVPPMKAAEALAYGKQLVVSDVAPLVEYAQKHKGVVSFEADSATSLAQALQSSLRLPASKPTTNLLFSMHTEPMVKALKGSAPVLKAAAELLSTPVDAEPTSPAVQLPFSDNLNVDFCLMSEDVKKKETPWTHINVAGIKKISIRAESKLKVADKKIILRVRFFNHDRQEVEPEKGAAYFSEAYKWFRYVTVFEQGSDILQSSVDIPISDAIASVGLSFINLGDINTDGFSVSLKKEVKAIPGNTEAKKLHENIFDYLNSTLAKTALQARAIIYGDISPNVLDGSSIWLTSITNIVSSTRPTLLLLKDNISNSKVVSNIERHDGLTVVEPKDIGFNAPLNQQAAAEALSLIHAHCPQVTALITRGVDLGYEIQKRKEFTGIFYPYVTDFYEISEQGFSLVDEKVKKLKEIVLNAKSVLFQTNDIYKKIEEIVGYKVDGFKLPPSIPNGLSLLYGNFESDKDGVIHIGYAGKVQPRWGVEELIQAVEKQISLGQKIKLHIATGKIYGRGKNGTAFVQRIKKLLNKDFVHLYDSLSRESAISLMAKMDLVWCYRDPHLENSTLELSTKLVETAAIGKPCLVYGSRINKDFLGENYPFFVNNPEDVSQLIENYELLYTKSKDIIKTLSAKVEREFTFSSLKESISTKLDEDHECSLKGKKIAISGHDLKFIYSYITHLRKHGAEVAIDPWEWGEKLSLKLSEYYSSWADYIFCEWGLANAVWHSKNKKIGKKLFVRIHAQEVRQKAEKFGYAIDDGNVDKFIFVSPLIRSQALGMFGWHEKKTNVIPNGVEENRFYDAGREVKPILGMVGIVPTTKRLDRALDLLAALNERGWEAKLYCKGHRPEDLPFMRAPGRRQELAYYKELHKRIENDPSLNGYVFFDGWGNDVEQWYQKVSFILSPSDNESFHYALADGVMAGCIPLVWPWNDASNVYDPDWLVSSTDDSVGRVVGYLNNTAEHIANDRELNRGLVVSKYGFDLTFSSFKEVFNVV